MSLYKRTLYTGTTLLIRKYFHPYSTALGAASIAAGAFANFRSRRNRDTDSTDEQE